MVVFGSRDAEELGRESQIEEMRLQGGNNLVDIMYHIAATALPYREI